MELGSRHHRPQRPHHPHLAGRRPSWSGAGGVLASARRFLAGGTVLGLASLVIGCAQQPAGPAMAGIAETRPVAVAAPDTEAVMGATGPEWVRPAGSPQTGQASYYGPEFTGRRMANGRRFNPHATVVAHRTLPFGTTVLVKNLGNGRATTATVEDRGPFIRGRIIDLSPRLAAHLGMVRQGVAPVEVMPVELAEAPEPVGAESAAPR